MFVFVGYVWFCCVFFDFSLFFSAPKCFLSSKDKNIFLHFSNFNHNKNYFLYEKSHKKNILSSSKIAKTYFDILLNTIRKNNFILYEKPHKIN